MLGRRTPRLDGVAAISKAAVAASVDDGSTVAVGTQDSDANELGRNP
jgi:hypothetical protein